MRAGIKVIQLSGVLNRVRNCTHDICLKTLFITINILQPSLIRSFFKVNMGAYSKPYKTILYQKRTSIELK